MWASSLLSCVGVSQERSSVFHEFLRWRQQHWGSSWLCRETGTHQLHMLPWSRTGWHFAPTAAIPELSASLFLLVIGPFQDIILAPSFHWSQGTRIYKNMNAEKRDLHERDSLKMNPNLTNNWLCDLEGNYPLWASISSTIKAILKKKKNLHYMFIIRCHITYVKRALQLELLFGTVYSIWQIYQTMYKWVNEWINKAFLS